MSFRINAGYGINIRQEIDYSRIDQTTDLIIELTESYEVPSQWRPSLLPPTQGSTGKILSVNSFGEPEWADLPIPFDLDVELRKEYPALEEAWKTLMAALNEYELTKKMVKDHDAAKKES